MDWKRRPSTDQRGDHVTSGGKVSHRQPKHDTEMFANLEGLYDQWRTHLSLAYLAPEQTTAPFFHGIDPRESVHSNSARPPPIRELDSTQDS